jgi:CRP/FNR family transcriptional regulator, cyclic AMP receptor protein
MGEKGAFYSPEPRFLKCESCALRKRNSFCDLPREALIELDRIKHERTFSPGERLFNEGSPADELMIVCEGGTALTLSSSTGKPLILGVSGSGEVLGLSSLISSRQHELSAEAVRKTRVARISRSEFLKLLERFPPAAINAGAELSRQVSRAYDKIRLLGGGLSVLQRVTAWLVHMQEKHFRGEGVLEIGLTHEQIAQLLGISRESVTRALSELRRRGVLHMDRAHFCIRDPEYLHLLAHAQVPASLS